MRTAALILSLLLTVGLSVVPSWAQEADAEATYTVQDGDTLYGIAREVGVSVRTLMRWNDLENASIQVGQTLRVRPPADTGDTANTTPNSETAAPAPPSPDTTAAQSSSPPDTVAKVPSASAADSAVAPPSHGRYTVEAGDTFVTLALRLGTTADTLFTLNDSTTAPLTEGDALRLPPRFGPPMHTVEPGQTLYSIAGEYGISVRALKSENDLPSDTLQPDQQLQIPRGAGAELPPPGQWAAPDTTGPVARYPKAFAGRLTASGTAYTPDDLVVSHPSLPFDSVVLVSTTTPERHTFARVIDRGPVEEGMLLDVSTAVANTLSLPTEGTPPTVALQVVWTAK